MPRFFRNAAILAKTETTYGTDAVPTGVANAVLVSNMSITRNFNSVSRDLIRPIFGASEQLAGTRSLEMSFDVEIAASGTAGTAPAWDALMQGCGFQAGSVLSTPSRVEYNLVTDYSTFKGLSIYYHMDGVLNKALGARGTVELKMMSGERPVFSFKFVAIDGGTTAAANPTQTLTSWKVPLTITDPNASDITLGCTYSAGALSGGTTYPSTGLSLNLGNDVKHIQLLGGESADIVNRESSGKMALDLTAAQEATLITDVAANTLTSLGFVFGTTAGAKILLFAPAVQRLNPVYEDLDGRTLVGMDLRLLPSAAAGNDELKIVAL